MRPRDLPRPALPQGRQDVALQPALVDEQRVRPQAAPHVGQEGGGERLQGGGGGAALPGALRVLPELRPCPGLAGSPPGLPEPHAIPGRQPVAQRQAPEAAGSATRQPDPYRPRPRAVRVDPEHQPGRALVGDLLAAGGGRHHLLDCCVVELHGLRPAPARRILWPWTRSEHRSDGIPGSVSCMWTCHAGAPSGPACRISTGCRQRSVRTARRGPRSRELSVSARLAGSAPWRFLSAVAAPGLAGWRDALGHTGGTPTGYHRSRQRERQRVDRRASCGQRRERRRLTDSGWRR